MKRFLKIVLNILTCLTLLFGLIIVSLVSNSHSPINSMEGLYFGLNIIWVFLLFLPVPIANILFGYYLKKSNDKYKSNMILGVVFSLLLVGYGSMHFLNKNEFSEDKSYIYNLEEKMCIDFPDEFTILTRNWTNDEQTPLYNIYLKNVSIIRFKGIQDTSFTSNWISNIDDKSNCVPIDFYYEAMNYDKFLIYCFDTKEINPININFEYDYVVIGYDYENNNLLIYEYYFKG